MTTLSPVRQRVTSPVAAARAPRAARPLPRRRRTAADLTVETSRIGPNAPTAATRQPRQQLWADQSAGAANPATSGKAARHLGGAPHAIRSPNPRAAPRAAPH